MSERTAEPLVLDPVQLRRLAGAMAEGYVGAIPEVTTEFEQGFVGGWKAAVNAIEKVADLLSESLTT